MRYEFVKLWLFEHGVEVKDLVHVTNMCMGILKTKDGSEKHGSFVKAVATEDWATATLVADFTNKMYIEMVYKKFVKLENEDDLMSQCFGTPEGFQQCEKCDDWKPDEKFPMDDDMICQDCCEAKADLMYECARDARMEG
jgi:hypothetical protein